MMSFLTKAEIELKVMSFYLFKNIQFWKIEHSSIKFNKTRVLNKQKFFVQINFGYCPFIYL